MRDIKAKGRPSALAKGAPRKVRSAGERDHSPKTNREGGRTQDERVIAAKLAEVARRYDRRRGAPAHGGPPPNVRRAEVWRLFRHRFGGLSKIDAVIFETVGDPAAWTATNLGRALRVSTEEILYLDIRTIKPFDRTAAQWRALKGELKRERDRKWRAKKRRAEKQKQATAIQVDDIDLREESLFACC